MTRRGDRTTFRNEDLVLKVTANVDPAVWDESRYESFLGELCGTRGYQEEAIRTTLRYLLGGRYANLRELAQENFEQNPELEPRYGSWSGMEKHLQLPDQLSCSLDQATATGKSYVLYGLAAISTDDDKKRKTPCRDSTRGETGSSYWATRWLLGAEARQRIEAITGMQVTPQWLRR